MSNRLEHLLSIWHQQKDEFNWVLATVVETEGSSYRKSGAMMFINELGQYFGLLSGGCLESDLMRKAKKVMSTGQSQTVTYDMREDSDIAWQIGIGCGGMVKILLQPVTAHSDYLKLEELQTHLLNRQSCIYSQPLDSLLPGSTVTVITKQPTIDNIPKYYSQTITPRPLLGIIGGGIDARPLCELATSIGWEVIVIDERVNFAVKHHFPQADKVYKGTIESIISQSWFSQLDAIAIMTHNIEIDGRALHVVQKSNAKYIGLLGPIHRTEKVLNSIELSINNLTHPLSNPIGLDIGGELPESIALSIVSEIHAVLEKKACINKPILIS